MSSLHDLCTVSSNLQQDCSTMQAQQQHMMHAAYELRCKLAMLGNYVAQRFMPSLQSFQAWLAYSAPGAAAGAGATAAGSPDVCMVAEPGMGMVGDQDFAAFLESCCKAPLRYKDGLPARVWRSGAVQVVQSLNIIPPSIHPRNRLQDRHLAKLGALLYIPIFDTTRPCKTPSAVLEVLLSSRSPEPMLMADLIGFIDTCGGPLGFSVSSPMPQPVGRSSLTGRRSRCPDSVEDLSQAPTPVAPLEGQGMQGQDANQQGQGQGGGGALAPGAVTVQAPAMLPPTLDATLAPSGADQPLPQCPGAPAANPWGHAPGASALAVAAPGGVCAHSGLVPAAATVVAALALPSEGTQADQHAHHGHGGQSMATLPTPVPSPLQGQEAQGFHVPIPVPALAPVLADSGLACGEPAGACENPLQPGVEPGAAAFSKPSLKPFKSDSASDHLGLHCQGCVEGVVPELGLQPKGVPGAAAGEGDWEGEEQHAHKSKVRRLVRTCSMYALSGQR